MVAFPVRNLAQIEDGGFLHAVRTAPLALQDLGQQCGLRQMVKADGIAAAVFPDRVENQATKGGIEAGGIMEQRRILVHRSRQRHQNGDGGADPAGHQRPDHQAFAPLPEGIDPGADVMANLIINKGTTPVEAPVETLEIGEGLGTPVLQRLPGLFQGIEFIAGFAAIELEHTAIALDRHGRGTKGRVAGDPVLASHRSIHGNRPRRLRAIGRRAV